MQDLNSVSEHFLAGTSSIKKSFWQGENKYKWNATFFKSADCPRNDKGIIKVARGNFKTLFLWAQKKKHSKWIYLKGVTLAKSRHLGLREVKLKEDTFFFPS